MTASSSSSSSSRSRTESRRDILTKALSLSFFSTAALSLPHFKANAAETTAAAATAQVTDKVYFDVEIAGKPAGRFTFGLYGKDAPTITGNFLKVLDGKAQGASYDYSTVFRVQKVCMYLWMDGWIDVMDG